MFGSITTTSQAPVAHAHGYDASRAYGASPALSAKSGTKSMAAMSAGRGGRVGIADRKAHMHSNLGEFKSVFQKEKDDRMTGVRKLLNYKN